MQTGQTDSLSYVQGDENKQNVWAWGVHTTSDQNGSCMDVCECVWGLSQSFPSGQVKAVLYSFYFLFEAEKKNPNHWTPLFTNTVPNLAPCCVSCPGLWPPEQCHLFEKGGQVGWGEWTWEGWWVTWVVSLPNPSMTSHPPLAVVGPVSPGLFIARWDAVGRGDTRWCHPHPTLSNGSVS